MNGRFVLFAAAHPLLFALLNLALYLGPGALLPAPVTTRDVMAASAFAAFWTFLAWRSRSRLRRAHRAFYSSPPRLPGEPA